MSKVRVEVNPLSPASIADAIDFLEAYKEKIEKATEELPRALSEIAAQSAQAIYDNSPYNIYLDGTSDTANISVTTEPTDDGWAVVASGEEVAFVEFGAGVYYNGDEPYLGTRPDGIVGIGEYGKGHGNQPAWGFEGGVTHGTPAANALYFAMRDAEDRIAEEAEKILGDKVGVYIDD